MSRYAGDQRHLQRIQEIINGVVSGYVEATALDDWQSNKSHHTRRLAEASNRALSSVAGVKSVKEGVFSIEVAFYDESTAYFEVNFDNQNVRLDEARTWVPDGKRGSYES